ncbi:MAG: glutamate mutase L [Actinobacteria bacterium]|nr:glutamate mutase L [Actinomycetota bacterium]
MSGGGPTVLVDFGSTFTKVRAVSPGGGLIAAAQHRTTIDTDVMDGLGAALDSIAAELGGPVRTIACSSAGGGLRMGVVGLIADLTAEAARQAALGAGARVLEVRSGGLADPAAAHELLEERPDIVLLAGGTDGGDRENLLRSARALAAARAPVPVVLAGNVAAAEDAAAILHAAGTPVFPAPNVMPAVGEVDPEPCRRLVRELFIEHVIGGKLGGSASTLKELVRMATPDAALRGVEVLAGALEAEGELGGGVIAVDIGGATTDVHSWAPAIRRPGYKHEMLGQPPAARTVEADLGMRWNAPGIVAAGEAEGLLSAAAAAAMRPGAERRAAEPGLIPADAEGRELDRALARTAITVALRRHAGLRTLTLTNEGAVLERRGRDLGAVRMLVGSGGVMSQMSPAELDGCLAAAQEGREDRLLPGRVETRIDAGSILAAAGLLADEDEEAAENLARTAIGPGAATEKEECDVVCQR